MSTEAEALGGSHTSAVLQHLQKLLGPLSGLSGELEGGGGGSCKERGGVTPARGFHFQSHAGNEIPGAGWMSARRSGLRMMK